DIEDRALGAAHELAQGRGEVLVVDAAQHVGAGAGVVVLDELVGNAVLDEALTMVVLDKEAALIAEVVRLDDDHTLQRGGQDANLHLPLLRGWHGWPAWPARSSVAAVVRAFLAHPSR